MVQIIRQVQFELAERSDHCCCQKKTIYSGADIPAPPWVGYCHTATCAIQKNYTKGLAFWHILFRRVIKYGAKSLQGENDGSPVVVHLLPHELVKLLVSVTAEQVEGIDTCSSIRGFTALALQLPMLSLQSGFLLLQPCHAVRRIHNTVD